MCLCEVARQRLGLSRCIFFATVVGFAAVVLPKRLTRSLLGICCSRSIRCMSACFEALLDIGDIVTLAVFTTGTTGFFTPDLLSVAELLPLRPIEEAG